MTEVKLVELLHYRETVQMRVVLHQDETAAPYDYDSKHIYHHYHSLTPRPNHP